MNNAIYKVLWIDDETDIVQGYQLLAGFRNIQLIHFANWREALPTLEKEFDELTAIILDANCKLNENDLAPSEFFLGNVLSSLMRMFGERHREIPWYILSAGTMTNFDTITNVLINSERRSHEQDWGKTVYLKTDFQNQAENNPLFDCIRRVGENYSNNIVLYRHKDTFKYLGDGKLICDDARKVLLKALAVVYFPEENINYAFAGNPLRQVLEYLFRSANTKGLLPDEFFKDGKPILWDSMQYMCGKDPSNIKFRYGNPGEYIFPERQNYLLLNILNYVNEESHTGGKEKYVIDIESKDMFFGFVFQLMNIIKCYGSYVEHHLDIEQNKLKMTPVSERSSQKISQPQKPIVEFIKNDTAASLIGKVFPVINMSSFPTVGGCKVAKGLQLKVLQRVRIEEVIENTEKDAKQYPFIVTKVTLQE